MFLRPVLENVRLPAWVRPLFRKAGFDLVRFLPFAHPLARRALMMRISDIDVVLDIGANVGQYAKELRSLGYAGRIVSFEPLTAPHEALRRAAAGDGGWECFKLAVGRKAGTGTINVSANTESSSLLSMRREHVRSAPESAYIGKEEIEIQTLEWALRTLADDARRPFVKIDAQGYEREIVEGAGAELDRVAGVQLELSLTPLYDGAPSFTEMVSLMEERGFALVGLEPGHSDPGTGRLLQTDGIFFRKGILQQIEAQQPE
jgi:FkbM family methyltransferase